MQSTSSAVHVLAAEIRAHLARRQLTQHQLGEAIGLSPQSVSLRMNGRVPWTFEEVLKVAQWLEIPVASLIPPVPEQSRTGT